MDTDWAESFRQWLAGVLTSVMPIWDLIGGSCRVTLVIAFGFLPQTYGRWWGPMNGTLSFYECRFSGGDTTLPVAIKFAWTFCTDRRFGGWDAKALLLHPLTPARTQELLCETSTTFNLSNDTPPIISKHEPSGDSWDIRSVLDVSVLQWTFSLSADDSLKLHAKPDSAISSPQWAHSWKWQACHIHITRFRKRPWRNAAGSSLFEKWGS